MIIILEGNIGSGKNILCDFFEEKFENVYVYDLDINENLLKDFKKDPKRWALTLNMHYSTKRTIPRNINDRIIVVKGSYETDRKCFLKACENLNYINEFESSIYKDIFVEDIEDERKIIYLESDSNICFNNSLLENIDFKYIDELNSLYDKWNKESKNYTLKLEMCKYKNIEGNDKLKDELMEKILKFYPELSRFIKDSSWTVVINKPKKRNNSRNSRSSR